MIGDMPLQVVCSTSCTSGTGFRRLLFRYCFLTMMAIKLSTATATLAKTYQKIWLSGCCNSLFHSSSSGQLQSVESTYGVGPIRGPENDPGTKGSVPDDKRADEQHHAAEPKEVTKDKAAVAQQEPPDFQVNKTMPGWGKTPAQPEDSVEEDPSKASKFTRPVDHESLWRSLGHVPPFA